MTYIIDGFYKHGEVDTFDKGCDPDTARFATVNVSFDGSSIADMLAHVQLHFEVTEDALDLDADETDGRIDIQRLETWLDEAPTDHQLQLWKQGEYTLWNVVYSGYLRECKPVTWKPKQLAMNLTDTEGRR